MEVEAAQCRGFAAKFKNKAKNAKLPLKRAFYLALARRYTLLAEINQREAENLRSRE
jgi:hypothetical protein